MTKAYNLYLRTARLDLDDYNKEAHEGLHITSMHTIIVIHLFLINMDFTIR